MIIHDGCIAQAVRSFFVLILCAPAVNEKREQIEIDRNRRPLRTIFSPAVSTASKHLSAPGSCAVLTHAPHALRGSIHTVSLKCAQSCPRADQIARGAVAPDSNRRHYGFNTRLASIG